ncbi:hypothetical protein TD95_000725 [Thielaviopsis punctulata]|uniref:Uncharacterized protein n=1 Tax=Thielaviopsis punctulata TaxID=72032 RepID=A0A0F4ZL59_9PEZI|nr:hypothetical protein TD95_000725 [Thielaviopsis punctulata]
MPCGESPVPPVAVVGFGMRLPGKISTSEDLWSLIVNKRDARAPIPASRWDAKTWKNNHATDHGYFLDEETDLKKFDSSMFSMSRTELESLDPRQRILLEVVWECMENAGQKEWRGTRTGVFVGSFSQDWMEMTARDPLMKGVFRIYNGADFYLPNRISYEYNLSGPSVAVQAACASGLTAVHEACTALYNGECKGAIAAGTSILLSPLVVEVMTQQGVLSPNGSCSTFSAEADGYARAESVNAVYLKLLDDALRDGDPIRGVIRGTALSANGKTNGMLLPDAKYQQKTIEEAYKAAGITDLTQTPFVECHGTGTPVGDPIEVRGVINAFGTEGEHGKPTYIGSHKPNLGHSEGASGINSLIKAVLAVENGIIPPNIKFNKPNPQIPFDTARLIVPVEPTPFPACRATRVSINSFGIGGANAHLVLDSAAEFLHTYPGVPPPFPAPPPGSHTIWPRMVVVTSSNMASLNQRVHDIKQYLDLRPRTVLNDVAYTLANRRSHLTYRSFAVVTHSQNEPFEFEKPQISYAKPPAPVFVFTGQGAQWGGMASDLLRISPVFAESIRTMDAALAKLGPAAPSWTLEKMIAAKDDETKALFDKPEFSQPLCTAVQVGVLQFMQACGVQHTAVVGHSSGEIAAAYAAGGLTLQEAIVVSYLRGWAVKVEQAKGTGTKGGMAAVGLGKTEAEKYVCPGVVVACENSPQSVTLSGDEDVLDAALSEISKSSVFTRRLKVDVAYHSHHMKNVGEVYDTALSPQLAKSKKKLSVPFYSSVTLEKVGNSEIFDTAYWCKNLKSPVRFNDAVQSIISDNPDKDLVFLEIGPHSTLQGPLRQIFQVAAQNGRFLGKNFLYIPTLLRNVPAKISLTKAAGHAFSFGIPVNFGILTPPPTPTSKPLTDLPRYPWDRNVEFWNESRLSVAHRFPKYPRHELLGTRGLEGTDLEPTWRNIIAPNDIPWVQDHVVGSDVILPCAGYVSMVGEALRQLSGDDNAGYTLREVEVKSALILPDNRAVEVMTTARLVRPSTFGEPGSWYEFSISSYNGSSWMQLYSAKGRSGAESGYPAKMPLQPTHKFSRKVSSEVWYDAFAHVGLAYGPKFQGLASLSAVPGEPLGSSTIKTFDEDISKKSSATYTQHPTTLDCALQLGLFASTSGLPKRLSAVLPTAIDFVYVKPASNLKSLYTQATFQKNQNKGKVLGGHSCRALDPQTFETIIDIQNCRHTHFQIKSKSNSIGNGFDHVGAASLVWRPDINFCKPEVTMKPLPDVYRPSKVLLEKIVALCVLHSVDVMTIEKAKVGSNDISFVEPHLKKYIAWLSTAKAEMLSGTGSWSRLCPEAQHFASMSLEQRENEFSLVEQQVAAMSSHNSDMGVMMRICRKLAENMYLLATGKANSVEIMFSRTSESLASWYDFLGNLLDFSEYFKLSGHANPNLRVLEIGAGTGASSARVLQALVADSNKPRYGEYTFTDVSSGFFEAARDRLKEYPNIKYKVLDISRDPAEQGFELGSYDLIVASNVIHATPNLNQTLTNTRALLRDGGRFYLQEVVGPTNVFGFLAGVFSGWWMGEFDGRPNAPTVSVDRWHQELIAAGFSGAGDAVLDDDETLTYLANIVTRAMPVKNQAPEFKTATIIYEKEKPTFASSLSSSLAANGFGVSWEKLEDFASSSVTPSVVISALDLEHPFFVGLTSRKYALLTNIILNLSTPLIWLTCPAQVDVENPHYAQIIGLGRNVRNELSKKFVTIELGSSDTASAKAVTKIVEDLAVNLTNVSSSSHYDADSEYFVKDGIVYTSRYETLMLDDELAEQSHERTSVTLISSEVGSFNKPKWIEESVVLALAANDVEVDVQATSLNYKYHDVMLYSNSLEGSENHIGVEAAGVVSRVGALVDNIKVGDRVVLIAAGAVSSVKVVNKDLVVKIPDSLDFEQAATLPISYLTAIHALSNLKSGQTVLIHSGSGSLGQAAIQVAQMLGATVFTTAGTEEKADFITSQFGIPPSRIFSSCDISFAYGVMFSTLGKGVDVVFNTLSGELLQASWGCVSPNGKMINMTRDSEQLPASAQNSSRTLISLNMGLMISERPSEVNLLLNKTLDHFSRGHIKPITISEVFSAKDVSHGFSHIQANKHMGRVVLTFNVSESLAAFSSRKKQSIAFSSFKTYLLAGGMGGLGKSIATWMVEHGARKFIFLSRSAGISEADKAFITELESQGCYVNAIASSVADASAVEKAVQSAPSRLGGIMQLSMVLSDASLSDMTYEQWMIPQGPKVDGTWNLHNATVDTPLDFFVLFSSISSVAGNPGQANYSSAGTFIEAFAQYRQRQGLACSVVNIGAVQGVGYISRHKTVSSTITSMGQSMLQEQDVLDSVQVSIQRPFNGCEFSEPVGNDKNGSFLFSGQLVTGLRSTRVTSNADCHVPWKRDIRTSIVQVDEAIMIEQASAFDSDTSGTAASNSANDIDAPNTILRDLVREVSSDTQKLTAKATMDTLVHNIGRVLCRILLQPEDCLENGVTLMQMGLDSMVGIEVRNWWKRTFPGDISVLQIINAVTIERLAQMALEALQKNAQAI